MKNLFTILLYQYKIIYREKFRSEIESLLDFLPVGFWLYHLKETNNYMKSSIKQKSENGTDTSSLTESREISFDELMTFIKISYRWQ